MNRPEILNAINWDMHDELEQVFVDLDRDKSVRAIVLTGAGRGFCSGGDQKTLDKSPIPSPTRGGRHLVRNMLEVEAPIIAAVNGVAVGLGATLALMCDVIFAQSTARFADTHVTAGVVAGDGGAVIWPLLIGPVRAKHYLMTGAFVSAEQAVAMGMINEAVSDRDVREVAIEYAEMLASGPREAIIWTKYSVNKIVKEFAHLLLDTSTALETLTFATPERREAVAAFAEKRRRFAER
ncbi:MULTISPECIES: enoyl-CoA hydratase/isomerase family protein [Bradyrhizobium]|nr:MULTISPECIES: enoyl-CoA hydratase-related protein [Bradyrhizobium]MCS3447225.1 enoyl-CoA hydratase/carnithine racemase [Bradyrhizobium elkanii]MCS3561639.1 enoyl-CoA hydratase/carnithine racemase [Bradyrhizobium elkanii]MCW2148521.1 enoyl-CoA hydratase/carnithine racemase [Bradyrhizobium elkanii]MCW2352392.1 enoyl-CoA hydratase/carnithine racemase [Bradyrhizobium elkanii]MCW2372249.1 enoyl-CoA hydratase/carnithine racemase [Bradyrhizobium elkanii]